MRSTFPTLYGIWFVCVRLRKEHVSLVKSLERSANNQHFPPSSTTNARYTYSFNSQRVVQIQQLALENTLAKLRTENAKKLC